MKTFKWSSLLTLALAIAIAGLLPLAAQGEPDWLSIVGLYPRPSSVPGQSEQYVLLWLQNTRTAQDVARANWENTPSLGCFASDIHLGAGFGVPDPPISLKDFPLTEAVLEQARRDVMPILQSIQTTFNRPRPYVAYSSVLPALPMPDTPSYPSMHATLGTLFADIIAQYDKTDRPGLETTGGLLGSDRVLGGVHYPSDVVAGQRLGKAYATWWIDNHLELIQTACDEWNAVRQRARNAAAPGAARAE